MPMGKPMAWILTITKNIAAQSCAPQAGRSRWTTWRRPPPSFDADSEEAVALEQAMKVLGDQSGAESDLHA